MLVDDYNEVNSLSQIKISTLISMNIRSMTGEDNHDIEVTMLPIILEHYSHQTLLVVWDDFLT